MTEASPPRPSSTTRTYLPSDTHTAETSTCQNMHCAQTSRDNQGRKHQHAHVTRKPPHMTEAAPPRAPTHARVQAL